MKEEVVDSPSGRPRSFTPIAVVGASALFPGSLEKTGFWRDILAGRDLLRDIPETHWLIDDYFDPDPSKPDKTYAKRGAFLDDVPFDPMEWGIPPSIVPQTDTTQLLGLIVAKQVLEDASRGQFASMDKSRTSCILGVTSGQELMGSMVARLQRPVWVKALREAGIVEGEVQAICDRISSSYTKWEEAAFPGLLGNVVAGRIANRLDLGGTNCVTDAACASTMSALSMAVNELALGQSDLVIAGGCDTMNDIFMYMCFSKTPALSPSGDCRPFSDQADGTMLGEGLGMLALKRLEDAERDGDHIYAVIRGLGSSSDGKALSVYAPLSKGQARAIERCYASAGFGPETVELIEAHGTGTKAGDAAEFEGLRIAFAEARERREAEGRSTRWCALGSVKSQIGHTKSAAGAASLIKAVLAVHHKVLPPTIKIERPSPKLELEDSPFYLNTEARPWVTTGEHPRRAGVSSFGFGGTNFHAVIEEYTGPADRAPLLRSSPAEVVLLQAADAQQLAASAQAMASEIERTLGEGRTLGLGERAMLRALAYESQGRSLEGEGARLAVVADGDRALAERLRDAALRIASGERSFALPNGTSFEARAEAGKLAFLFPGQGSQYLAMGKDLAMTYEAVQSAWALAASVPMEASARLDEVVFPRRSFDAAEQAAQAERIKATEWAQPALGAVSLGIHRLLTQLGLVPAAVAGHSFGEVMALHAAGALSAEDALRVARARGERMRDAARTSQGSMSAVIGSRDEVAALVEGSKLDVVIANHNAPDQVVVSGSTQAIEQAEAIFRAKGLTTKRLEVATAFHSPIVEGAIAPFAAFLEGIAFGAPSIPVIANATADAYPSDAASAKRLLASQLGAPVRFVESIERLYAMGVRTFVEVGANGVLTRLVGKILEGRAHHAVAVDKRGQRGETTLAIALGRLAVLGLPLSLASLWERFERPIDPRSRAAPKMTLALNGSNYGKPYPPKGGARALPAPNLAPRPSVAATAPSPAPSSPSAAITARVAVTSSASAPPASTSSAPAPHAPARAASSEPSHGASPRTPMSTRAPMNDDRSNGSSHGVSPSAAWLGVYAEAQRQTAETHASFARSMAEAHAAFLRASEASFLSLASLAGASASVSLSPSVPPSLPAPSVSAPSWPSAPVAPPAPSFVALAPSFVAPAPAPSPRAVAAPVVAPPPTPAPAPAVSAAKSVDLEQTMLAVVAEKTGYPAEMITPSMELEADLGIDSIKRVEILSAVRERAPGLAEIDPAELGALRTVGEIVERLRRSLAGAPASPSASPSAVSAPAPAASAAKSVDLEQTMLAVVAEKTGYPAEMITPSMELEADLGIDSIKRVEILSAVRERAPGLAEIDPAELGALRTVGEIVERLRRALGDGGANATRDARTSSALSALSDRGREPVPKTADGLRWVLRAVARPATGLVREGLLGARDLVVVGSPLASPLAAALARRGLPARAATSLGPDTDAVIDLSPLGAPADASLEAALATLRASFQLARALAPRLGAKGTGASGAYIVVEDLGGDFGLTGSPRAWLGGASGLVKTARQEWPRASVRVIDLEGGAGSSAPELAERLADELVQGGVEPEVGLRASGERVALESVARRVEDGPSVLERGDVVVVSGGARGVTAGCVIELVRRTGARAVLLGRSALEPEDPALARFSSDAELKRAVLELAKARGEVLTPPELGKRVERIRAGREIRATLEACRAAGGDARYVPLDVQDAVGVALALERVRAEWGPIRAIVHGAGVIADRLIAEKTDAQWDRVLDTKVRGLDALLQATKADPLRAIVMFSSVAARTGNVGQCDYASANEILNKVASHEARRRRALGEAVVARSLGWGPWEGGMVSPALKARFEKLGVRLIGLEEGARWMSDELTRGAPDDVEIVLGGEPRPEALLAEGGESAPQTERFEARISGSSHPFVDSHRVKGAPVLPAVTALDLLLRAARALRPGEPIAELRDLAVLKGIRLAHFDGPDGAPGAGPGDRFVVLAESAPGDVVSLQLLAGAGAPRHYAAKVRFGAPLEAPSLGDLGPLAPLDDVVYDGFVLFHGPLFHAIREIEGESERGIRGTLIGRDALGWAKDEGAPTDGALLDGALQLAVHRTKHTHHGASLPTSIARFVPGRSPRPRGVVTASVHARGAQAEKARFDVELRDEAGALVARLEGLEVFVLPGSRAELARASAAAIAE